MKKCITVRFTLPGIHLWPEAKSPVGFLAFAHRHLFYFECKAEVKDSNREIEFLTLQRNVQDWVKETWWNEVGHHCAFGPMSCEMIAERILKHFPELFEVSVFEDNENGATLTLEYDAQGCPK